MLSFAEKKLHWDEQKGDPRARLRHEWLRAQALDRSTAAALVAAQARLAHARLATPSTWIPCADRGSATYQRQCVPPTVDVTPLHLDVLVKMAEALVVRADLDAAYARLHDERAVFRHQIATHMHHLIGQIKSAPTVSLIETIVDTMKRVMRDHY